MNTACSDCTAPAVCEYGWGAGTRYGCTGHDPLKPPRGTTAQVPRYYRTITFPPAATVAFPGTIGMTPPDRMTAGITPGVAAGPVYLDSWTGPLFPPARAGDYISPGSPYRSEVYADTPTRCWPGPAEDTGDV